MAPTIAPGMLAAPVYVNGPTTSGFNTGDAYNPTHWAVVEGDTITDQITGATDLSSYGLGAGDAVSVFIKSSTVGNTTLTGTIEGDGTTIDFTWTVQAPGGGDICFTTDVAYHTLGNVANNQLLPNGQGNAQAGFAIIDESTGALDTNCSGGTPLVTTAITTNPMPSSTVVGQYLNDQATLSQLGMSPATPGGTITFDLMAPDNTLVYEDIVSVSGFSSYDTTMGTWTGSNLAAQVGTYEWVASYSGDTTYGPSVSPSGSEPVTVEAATPSLTTSASETTHGVVGSAVLSDTATLSGG
jgi:hypothetical protein